MTTETGARDGDLVFVEEIVVGEHGIRRRLPLGALLVQEGVASEDDIRDALDEGNRSGEKLGQVALRRGWVSERKLAKMLAEQWGLKAPNPTKLETDPAALARIDPELAAKLGGLPVGFDENGLVVAVAEPRSDRFEALRALLGNVSFVVLPPSTLTQLLDERRTMLGTTLSPVERVGAWLRPPTENPPTTEETHARNLPDEAPSDEANRETESTAPVEQTHARNIPDEALLDEANLETESTAPVEQTHARTIPDEALLDEANRETESTAPVEQTHARDTRDEIPLNDITFKEEPMATMEQLHEEAQPASYQPTFTALPQPSSVVEHLHELIGALEALDHHLVETRQRLQAQETELTELRQARATDLETINSLATELEQRRRRMDALRTATRQLADEIDR